MRNRKVIEKSARLLALEILKDMEEFDDIPANAEKVLMKIVDKEIESIIKTPEMEKMIKKEVANNLKYYIKDYVNNLLEDTNEGLAQELINNLVRKVFRGFK